MFCYEYLFFRARERWEGAKLRASAERETGKFICGLLLVSKESQKTCYLVFTGARRLLFSRSIPWFYFGGKQNNLQNFPHHSGSLIFKFTILIPAIRRHFVVNTRNCGAPELRPPGEPYILLSTRCASLFFFSLPGQVKTWFIMLAVISSGVVMLSSKYGAFCIQPKIPVCISWHFQ